MSPRHVNGILAALCLAGLAVAAPPARVDFASDVLPIFRQNCVGCHGPQQQMSGLRLDRKSSVLKNGLRRVVPGSSENSFLYYRLVDGKFGMQMPPAGPLRAEQVAVIKTWIDQGANWPDTLANEADLPPLNPKAVAMVEALRTGDRPSFLKSAREDPKLLNARGPEGSTPFMYAALYGDAALLEQLVKRGADVNARNDARATALMWTATDLAKTRALVALGADVNAQSEDARTPLMIAAGRPGGMPIVKLLLEHGANPNPTKNPMSESSPLVQAALAADPDTMRLLLDRGADAKASGGMALVMAITVECGGCFDLLAKQDLGKDIYTFALLQISPLADTRQLKLILDRGAEVNARDPFGRTALMYYAVADTFPVDAVKLLIERGADVNARSGHEHSGDTGMSVLDIAKMQGATPVVDALVKAGAKSAVQPAAAPRPQAAASLRAAVERSLPLLQRTDAAAASKAGCVSCHNNSLEAMTVGLARKHGFRVDEAVAARQVQFNVKYLVHQRESLHQGFFLAQAGVEAFGDTFGPGVLGYILMGLHAERYQPDLDTDAVAIYLKSRQMTDGRWASGIADQRQPLCSSYVGQTVLSMRGLQLYAPKSDKAEYEKAVARTSAWLAGVESKTNEDRTWRLLGLAWAGKNKDAIRQATREILDLQRPDGGWSDLQTIPSNAYATGRALVALEAAGVPVSDAAWQKGIAFLRDTQMEDGSWYVRTRALAFQPFFDSGFPHGVNQSISAAGTSWATMALTLASGAKTTSAAAR